MYHGSRNSELNFFPGVCFTSETSAATVYGHHVHEVEVDTAALTIRSFEFSDEELRERIDEQEWPCDRQSEIDSLVEQGYDAVAYTDVDADGCEHDCIRILTQAAWDAAVK